jgi:hypothetical protein
MRPATGVPSLAPSRLPACRPAPVRGGFDVFSEFTDPLLERSDPFQLDVLLVAHLDEEAFHPHQTPRDRLHDGDNGRNSSTSGSVLFCHHRQSTRSGEPADVLFCTPAGRSNQAQSRAEPETARRPTALSSPHTGAVSDEMTTNAMKR